MTIGVFAADDNMQVLAPECSNPLGYAYYLIDDVSVKDVTDSSELPYTSNASGANGRIHVTLGDAHFDFDKATLTNQALTRLAVMCDTVPPASIVSVDVQGHTDSTGSAEYNQRLSEARASAVARQLTILGVNKNVIVSRGFGFSHPISSIPARNRRVEIKIMYDSKKE